MITLSFESKNLHVNQIQTIQVNHVAHVPPCAIWLRRQRKQVYSPLDCANRDDISGSHTKTRLTMVASIVQVLHLRLMSLLDNHHTSSLTFRPCCKQSNESKKPCNAGFSILDDKKSFQLCGNASSCGLKVAIWTRPHPEKHCIISWWLMLSTPCGPSATNHINCLVVALKRCHRNCYCVLPNVVCIVEMSPGIATALFRM